MLTIVFSSCSEGNSQTISTVPKRSKELKQELADSIKKCFIKNTISEQLLAYADSADVVYTIEPMTINKQLVIVIEATFKQDIYDSTCLALYTLGYLQQHDSLIYNVEALTQTNTAQPLTRNKYGWWLVQKPRTRAFIRYAVIQDSVGVSYNNLVNPFAAIILPSYFLVHRNNLFLVPATSGNQWLQNKGSMAVIWKNMPKHWRWLNNFGMNDSVQIIKNRSYQFLVEGLFFAGDTSAVVTCDTVITGGRVFSGALQRSWQFPSSDLLHLINKVVGIERDFMQAHTTASYSAMTAGIAVEKREVIAHGFTSSFLAWFSDKETNVNEPALKHTIAHEILHTWNIGSKVKYNAETGFQLYFMEGITDYFARKILFKANLLTQQEYLQHYNRAIGSYYTSEHRQIHAMSLGMTNAANKAQHVAYWKGDILAHNWNREIEVYTHGKYSLDDVFRSVLKSNAVVTDSSFAAIMKPYMGRDIMPDILRIMRDGGEVVPMPDALGEKIGLRNSATIKRELFIPTEWGKIPQYYLREN